MKESKTAYSYLIEHLESPSFKVIRNLACDFVYKLPQELCDELYNSLNRGVNILDTEPLLQMYFYSFGEMHYAKLNYAFEHLRKFIKGAKEVELIDYGCGQGLATMCYHDYIVEVNPKQAIKQITLIEPSDIALARAELLCSKFFPKAKIRSINKSFEELTVEELNTSYDIPTIHLFSNILDVESYDIKKFSKLVKTISNGENEYVIVSPVQNNKRMERLKLFSDILECTVYYEKYLYKRELIKDKDWTCAVLLCSSKIEHNILQLNLDNLYDETVSIVKNRERNNPKCQEIFHKLNIGALSGNMKCQNALGVFYKYGIGIDKDYNKAFEWYSKATAQGFSPAISNLAICYLRGIGTEINYENAFKLFKKATELGNTSGYVNLAYCYMYGSGVEKDTQKAVSLLKNAADKGNAKAQGILGKYYLEGFVVNKDLSKAIQLLSSASIQNDVFANNLLGMCYRKGIGVEIDISMSIHYYTKAGLLEDKESIYALIEIFKEKEYKNLFGNAQFDVFVKAVHLGIPEISKITHTWLNREPPGVKDGNVVYSLNGLRLIKTV